MQWGQEGGIRFGPRWRRSRATRNDEAPDVAFEGDLAEVPAAATAPEEELAGRAQ